MMSVKQYFKEISNYVNNLTDQEFIELLEESGLENCPLKEEMVMVPATKMYKPIQYTKSQLYVSEGKFTLLIQDLTVA